MTNGAPYYYDYKNAEISKVTPNTLHVRNTLLQEYFARYLVQKIMSVFDWVVPENWDKDYFLYTLFTCGYAAVFQTVKFGVIPQYCTLSGYNVFYRPNKALVTNPLLPDTRELSIGVDCEIIKLMPNYSSISDIVNYYADLLALCAETATTNIYNSKLSYVFFAKNKAQAETYKKMYDSVTSGDPAVVIDSVSANKARDGGEGWEPFAPDLRSHYIASDILDDMLKIVRMFETDVGIPNSNTEKKERLVTEEVTSNDISTQSKASLWLETMRDGAKRVNARFYGGREIVSVDWRFKDASNTINSGYAR